MVENGGEEKCDGDPSDHGDGPGYGDETKDDNDDGVGGGEPQGQVAVQALLQPSLLRVLLAKAQQVPVAVVAQDVSEVKQPNG